jgi:uncharacterized LabA/DUF88 family protein
MAGLLLGKCVTARVMVFIDYQNVHLVAHRRFLPLGSSPSKTHVDPNRIGELIMSRRSHPGELAGIRVYRGRPSPSRQPSAAAAYDRQMAAWATAGPVTVTSRPLRYPPGWPTSPAQEKGVDVALAVDFVRLAMQRTYEVGVVFSSDTDLLPALEMVAEQGLARVEVAAWSNTFRLRIGGTTRPWCHHLTARDYEAVLDPTDYTKPPPAARGQEEDTGR